MSVCFLHKLSILQLQDCLFDGCVPILGKLSANRQNGGLQVKFGMICGIDMDTNSIECGLECFLGSGIQHFVANIGRIRIPRNENEFGRGPPIIGLEIEIDESVTTIIIRHVGTKVLVGFGAIALLVNDNGLFVFNLVNIIAQFLSLLQLELVESGGHFVVDNYSNRLIERKMRSFVS